MKDQHTQLKADKVVKPDDSHRTQAQKKASLAYIAAGLFMALFIVGAVLVSIGGAVIAPGYAISETDIKRVEHPTGGVVSAVYASDGTSVTQGAVLMRLDTNVASLGAQSAGRSLGLLLAQRARLSAEVEGQNRISFPVELINNPDPASQAALRGEQRRFQLNLSEKRSLLAQSNERVKQLGRQLDGFQIQIEALRQQRALIEPELNAVRQLKEKGYVTIRRVNELERAAIELEGSIGALFANVAQGNARIAEAKEQRIQLDKTLRTQAATELAQVEAAINEQRVENASAKDVIDRSAIRAPIGGVVDKLAYTLGEVVPPGETIMEISPNKYSLVFEGAISLTDIDQVKMGQESTIRLSGLNAASTPELFGKVNFISPNPESNKETGSRYYRIRISLNTNSQGLSKTLNITPGMPAELFIKTQGRSILSYITKPLRDQFSRAFRD